jgi:transposase
MPERFQMYFATKAKRTQILVWLIWAVACLVFLLMPKAVVQGHMPFLDLPALAAVASDEPGAAAAFPWQPHVRWRKWAWRRYCAWRRAHQRALWVARLARLGLTGALTLAQLVDLVTQAQFRRHLGALPVLYTLLDTLQLRDIINHYCPTRAEVDHGTVALVLALNRLTMPLPAYQLADWFARTVLVPVLGIPAAKFNDDRVARTLDAIQPHCQAIWQEVIDRAIMHLDLDLSVIFYDLTAFVVHGAYPDSQHIDFGFAHNTPMGKRKFKVGLNVIPDGRILLQFGLWSGRTADIATVQDNMERLKRLLQRRGCSAQQTLIVGDRANLEDRLAIVYDDHGLRYLAGMRLLKKVHQALVWEPRDAQLYAQPLTDDHGPEGYYGQLCQVLFQPKDSQRQVTHRGLVVLSGPMRTAVRQDRARQLGALRHSLREVETKIGQPYLRTVMAVQRRAEMALKASKVGKLMRAEAYQDDQDQVRLRWWVERDALHQAMQRDGRYLLVTNDESLSPRQMLALYHRKDDVEKCARVAKSHLRVSPIYVHKDERIEAMLLINMLALLAYSVLERQARQGGLQVTTRHIIERLESLDVVETHCIDGSRLVRLAPMDDEQVNLLSVLAQILSVQGLPGGSHPFLAAKDGLLLALPPPARQKATL